MLDDFAVFITSHGRPDRCLSLDTLRASGYTGKWYIVLDDMDDTVTQYAHKDNIIVFSKFDYIHSTDTCVGSVNPQLSAVLYARNAVEDIARAMKLKYFVVMDDDVVKLRLRIPQDDVLKSYMLEGQLDDVFSAYVEYMRTAQIDCLSFACTNTFIGGIKPAMNNFINRRACHNLFIRSTDREIRWSCVMNEDYATALRLGNIGKIFLTPPEVQQDLIPNNGDVITNDGGMSQFYRSTSSFIRSFYPVIIRPDATAPKWYKNHFVIGVNRNYAWPKIISAAYRKE